MRLWQVVELLLLVSTVLGVVVEHVAGRTADRDEETEYVPDPAPDEIPPVPTQTVMPYFYPWLRPNRATPGSCGPGPGSCCVPRPGAAAARPGLPDRVPPG